MKHYYETYPDGGGWSWKVYHWDDTGNKQLIDGGGGIFSTEGAAADRATDWAEENGVDVELA